MLALVAFRSFSNVLITFILAVVLPSEESALLFFCLMLSTQVRGAAELNLSNFCVLRLQDGANLTGLSLLLLVWQFFIVLIVLTICAIFDIVVIGINTISIVFFVVCNQGIWSIIYAYGSADGKFNNYLVIQGGLLSALSASIFLAPKFLAYLFFVYSLLTFIYFLTVVASFHDTRKRTQLLFNQILIFIQPFFVNNLTALLFVLVSMPLVVKLLSDQEYVLYSLATQIAGLFLFLYRGISKKLLAFLYTRGAKNQSEDRMIIALLFVASSLFFAGLPDLSFPQHASIQLKDAIIEPGLFMLSCGLGIITLVNLHQNNTLQSIEKNWPLLAFRILSNSFLFAGLLLLYFCSVETTSRAILIVECLVCFIVVIATRGFLNQYWRNLE